MRYGLDRRSGETAYLQAIHEQIIGFSTLSERAAPCSSHQSRKSGMSATRPVEADIEDVFIKLMGHE